MGRAYKGSRKKLNPRTKKPPIVFADVCKKPIVKLAHKSKSKLKPKSKAKHAAVLKSKPIYPVPATSKTKPTKIVALHTIKKSKPKHAPSVKDQVKRRMGPTQSAVLKELRAAAMQRSKKTGYPGHLAITKLNFGITTKCSLHCYECCCGIPYIDTPEHQSLDAIKQIAVAVYKIPSIVVTGGEPMLHPAIAEVVQSIREWAECKLIAIATNAIFPARALMALQYIDHLQMTHYGPHTYPDQIDNMAQICEIVQFVKDNKLRIKLHTNKGRVHKRLQPHGKYPCKRAFTGLISSAYGLFYGCCVAPGVPGAIGVKPEGDWRSKLMETPLPCYNCRFGVGAPVLQKSAPEPWDASIRLIAE